MRSYLVSYDLSAPSRDYTLLVKALKSYSSCVKVLESVWLISTSHTAAEVRNQLKSRVDSDDKLVVVAVKRGWATYNVDTSKVTAWMRNHIA